jgi:hypothetical protein
MNYDYCLLEISAIEIFEQNKEYHRILTSLHFNFPCNLFSSPSMRPNILLNLSMSDFCFSVRKILYYMDRNLDIISTLLSFNKTYRDVGQIEEAIVKSPKERLSMLYLKPEGKQIGCKMPNRNGANIT